MPAPEIVAELGRAALQDVLDQLPAGALARGIRLELTTVDPDILPRRAVARSVPVDAGGADLAPGTAPPDGGGYRIELSDRAADVNVARAVAHEVAELSTILQRDADGLGLPAPHALRPGEFLDDSALSQHDLGRLAEVEVLTQLLGDPAHARSELAALRDHLGLGPDAPPARRDLAEAQLTDATRDALRTVERPGGPPDAGLVRALAELRSYFPREWVRVTFDSVRITTADGTTIAIRVESGATGAGAADIRFDPRTREDVIVLSDRLRPADVVRTLADRVAGILSAQTGGRPDAGELRQLDVLATEQARIRYRLDHTTDAPPARREVRFPFVLALWPDGHRLRVDPGSPTALELPGDQVPALLLWGAQDA